MPFDNPNALSGILITGGICPDAKKVTELDTIIRQAIQFYKFRCATKLSKKQSVALDDFISERPDDTLGYIQGESPSSWEMFFVLLKGREIEASRLKGRPVAPKTRLFLDLTL